MSSRTPKKPKVRTFHEAGATLQLIDRGSHYELTLGPVPLLTSAALETELAFGRLAGRWCRRPDARVIVGGLGFGATARGALESVGPAGRVEVVERLATVVRLVRGELASLSDGVLDDPRLTLTRRDVRAVIADARDVDAILLDVDNGPEWASFPDNAGLYDQRGLESAMNALRPGGAYAVWSGYRVDDYVLRLRAAGFVAETLDLVEKGRVQARAYVGIKPR
jgi:tRNA A58 N-methylase Trm61